MKTFVSSQLQAHMASPAMTLAWYWLVVATNADGSLRSDYLASTTHTDPIAVPTLTTGGGALVFTPSPSFTPTDIAMTSSLSQNNLDIDAVLDSLGFTEKDIRARKWQAAVFEIGVFNYLDLTMGSNTLIMGTLGGFTGGDISVKIEQRGLSQPLEANMDGVTGPMCRVAVFSQGPGKCNVDPAPYRRTGTVAGASADQMFVDPARTEADDWWTGGVFTVVTGAAAGQSFDVKHSLADGTIELVDEIFDGLNDGDTYSMTPGCNKLLKIPGAPDADGNPTMVYMGDCKVKYDNVLNMQAEPETPGQIAIQQYGGQSVVGNDS